MMTQVNIYIPIAPFNRLLLAADFCCFIHLYCIFLVLSLCYFLTKLGQMANHGDIIYENNKAELKAPKVSRLSMGSDRNIDQSPLHQPSKISGKGSGGITSPSWNHMRAHSTPGRLRPSSILKGNDTVLRQADDSPAVPKFGDWDENDPNSGEGFTQMFQLVRDEKHSGAGKVPNSANDASYHNGHKHYGKKSSKICGCFPWVGK